MCNLHETEKWAEHEKNFLPYVLFGQLRPYLDRSVNNILAQECGLYSDKYRVAGRVDCIAKYNGVKSIIDFKTSTKERNDEWNESYYIQASAYAEMFEERTGIKINQIVILVVTEDGVVQEFVKTKDEYLPKLIEAIDDFTIDWEKENEAVDESPAVIGVLFSGTAFAEPNDLPNEEIKPPVMTQEELEEQGMYY